MKANQFGRKKFSADSPNKSTKPTPSPYEEEKRKRLAQELLEKLSNLSVNTGSKVGEQGRETTNMVSQTEPINQNAPSPNSNPSPETKAPLMPSIPLAVVTNVELGEPKSAPRRWKRKTEQRVLSPTNENIAPTQGPEKRKICMDTDAPAVPNDRFCWGQRRDGIFTVRSGYHFALNENRVQSDASNSGRPLPDYQWQKLWSIPSQPKQLHFIWRLMHNSLPVRANLIKRGIQCSPLCPWCLLEPETEDHLFRGCTWTKLAWNNSPLGDKIPTAVTTPIGKWIDELLSSLQQDSATLFITLCYSFWLARNKKVFEQQDTPLALLFSKVVDSCRSFANTMPSPPADSGASRRNSTCWIPPPTGYYKINIDAALGSGRSWGCGIIIRDSAGHVLAAATLGFSALPDVSMAEAMTAKLGTAFS
ncbi:Reverse transcriptase zinc-binding domain [Sesbania bispinosa]|nr:Reverse transcriptase zinc-binding domain [Sesbania bispinosa]